MWLELSKMLDRKQAKYQVLQLQLQWEAKNWQITFRHKLSMYQSEREWSEDILVSVPDILENTGYMAAQWQCNPGTCFHYWKMDHNTTSDIKSILGMDRSDKYLFHLWIHVYWLHMNNMTVPGLNTNTNSENKNKHKHTFTHLLHAYSHDRVHTVLTVSINLTMVSSSNYLRANLDALRFLIHGTMT